MIVHTRLLFWADGMAVAPWLILIHPTRRGDEPLLVHERTHCQQMREHGWWAFVLQYAFSRAFRLRMELEAYRAQIEHITAADSTRRQAAVNGFARALSEKYMLRLTYEQARALLQ